MKQIYIVTNGCYSDYDIEAVFSTKEKAENFVENKKYNVDREIQCWNVDEFENYVRKDTWHAQILRCGDGWTVDVVAHIFGGLKNENI